MIYIHAFSTAAILMSAVASSNAAETLAQITVKVVDEGNGGAITNFSYSWWIAAPGKDDAQVHEGASSNGQFRAMVPETCELNFRIIASDLLAGYGRNGGSYEVSAKQREFVFKAQRGVRVCGTAVAADTGKPVAGADVGPIIFCPPLFVPDRERLVKTDANGKFELAGVERGLGIGVAHPEYVENRTGFNRENQFTTNADGSLEVVLKLNRGKKLVGVVKDADGKLLAGVEVETGDGKTTLTDARGGFHFQGIEPARESMLILKKAGFVDKWLDEFKMKHGCLEITMERQPGLQGRVVGPNGQPVTEFSAWAGPGREPPQYSCSQTQGNFHGTFQLSIRERCETNWVGICAPGFSPWFGNVALSNFQKEIIFRLEPGVAVKLSGAAEAEKRAGLRAQLRLVRMSPKGMVNPDDPSQQQFIATYEALPDASGAMEFRHVAAGHYRLTIRGPKISPLSMDVVVGKTPVDLGAIKLRGTGTIAGRMFPAKESMVKTAYARGEIYFQVPGETDSSREPILFTADANGFFRVENVPVGDASVNLPFMATADIRDAIIRKARVAEGKTTEVYFFGSQKNHDLRIRFRVGDGSQAQYDSGTGSKLRPPVKNVTDRKPMFLIELKPPDNQIGSWEQGDWEGAGAADCVVLHDMSPGSYHMKIYDWGGSRGMFGTLIQTNIEIESSAVEFTVPLGAGAIAGTIKAGRDEHHVQILATPAGSSGHTRTTWSDDRGHFCVRYLAPGSYRVFAHCEAAGWSDLGEVKIGTELTHCKSTRLQPGATLEVEVTGASGKDIVAIDDAGRTLEPDWNSSPPVVLFHHLWPGNWTIATADNQRAITNVVVSGGETARISAVSP